MAEYRVNIDFDLGSIEEVIEIDDNLDDTAVEEIIRDFVLNQVNFLSKSSNHCWDDADTIVPRLNYIKNNVDRWSCDDAAKEQEW